MHKFNKIFMLETALLYQAETHTFKEMLYHVI